MLHWHIDELSWHRGRAYIHGWLFDDKAEVRRLLWRLPNGDRGTTQYGLQSPDVAKVHGAKAECCRFDFDLSCPAEVDAADITLIAEFDNGRTVQVSDLSAGALKDSPVSELAERFIASLKTEGGRVLEIGSRARSGNTHRSWVPRSWEYVGFDLEAGPNVDVVGDAHQLSRYFPPKHFDAVFSISTFEHLRMPWVVAIEINQVLRMEAIGLHCSHQAWPLHDQPADYFRFSSEAWRSLFNQATGFEVIETAMGEPGYLTPRRLHSGTMNLGMQCESYLSSAVLCRKVGGTAQRWNVPDI